MSNIKWNTAIIEVPNEFDFINKKGVIKSAKPISKTGNISTRNKQKAIKLEINNDIDHIKIKDQGQKINKKPTIKVSKPIITENKTDNTTTPLNYENKNYKFTNNDNELINLIKNKFNNKKIELEKDEFEFSRIFENYYTNLLNNNNDYQKLRNEINQIYKNITELQNKKRKTKLDKDNIEKLVYTDIKNKNIEQKKIKKDVLYNALLKLKKFWGPYINKKNIEYFSNSNQPIYSFINTNIDFNKLNNFLNKSK